MSKAPELSIIVPVRNEERRIERCIDSILVAISEINAEIIVVDNGSTDRTAQIAKNMGCLVLIAPEASIAGLRNLGAKNAKAQILGFVDADIEVSPEWAKFAVDLLQNSENFSCVTGKINISSQPSWVEKTWGLNRVEKSKRHFVNWASSMNMFVKNKDFFKINGFNTNLITCEDVDLSYRFRQAGMKIFYDEMVSVTHHGEAKTLVEFFKKEKWRGTSMIDGIISHGLKKEELPSLFQIVFFLFSFVMLLSFVVSRNFIFSIISCVALIILPLARAIFISYKNTNLSSFFKLVIVWLVYYIARSISFTMSILRLSIKIIR